jgi:hypothetical protein
MSDHLKAFLSAYVAWVDAGAPQEKPFSRRYGLCSNLTYWALHLGPIDRHALEEEMDEMFDADGLDRCHPFGVDEYFKARNAYKQHLDAKRIAWVEVV